MRVTQPFDFAQGHELVEWQMGVFRQLLNHFGVKLKMRFYLIENMMGFERPVEEGDWPELESTKQAYEKKPTTRKVGSESDAFLIEATYYIVAKDDWDMHNCPLIPVDLS
ncbi:MAG: hypothetical protein PVJ69_05290 [Desulfobacteraceae bacterium]|jgi:hypothetical protein